MDIAVQWPNKCELISVNVKQYETNVKSAVKLKVFSLNFFYYVWEYST
jgi:hypothetical protein